LFFILFNPRKLTGYETTSKKYLAYAMVIISVLAIIGLSSLILGLWSVLYISRFSKSEHASLKWKKQRISVLVIGLIIAVLSWPGTILMGYPLSFNGEVIRVVGIPFIVAYFDSRGHDYVGSITLLSPFGNVIFWFLIPHILFGIHTKYKTGRIKDQ